LREFPHQSEEKIPRAEKEREELEKGMVSSIVNFSQDIIIIIISRHMPPPVLLLGF